MRGRVVAIAVSCLWLFVFAKCATGNSEIFNGFYKCVTGQDFARLNPNGDT